MVNGSKRLSFIEVFRPSSHSGILSKKIVCIKKLTMPRFVCGFPQFFLSSILIIVSSAPNRWGYFNFKKLKSLGKRFFLVVTEGGEHNSDQNNYHTKGFFSRKSKFYGHFQRKNSFYFYIISFKITYKNSSLMMISSGEGSESGRNENWVQSLRKDILALKDLLCSLYFRLLLFRSFARRFP